MPNAKIDGMAAFGGLLDKLSNESESLLKTGLYDANKEIYTEVERELSALPEGRHELTPEQKQGLINTLYGSKMQNKDGEVYFIISVTGYNEKKTEKYPKGQPNIMILRSLERGTSYLHKHPVMRKSLNRSKKAAVAAMQNTISKEIAEMQKG